MYEKTVLDITAKVAPGREDHMQVIFNRSFSGDMWLRLQLDVCRNNTYIYGYPRAYDRFKARFESYLRAYFVKTEKSAREIAARTYKEIERVHEDSEPFRVVSVD